MQLPVKHAPYRLVQVIIRLLWQGTRNFFRNGFRLGGTLDLREYLLHMALLWCSLQGVVTIIAIPAYAATATGFQETAEKLKNSDILYQVQSVSYPLVGSIFVAMALLAFIKYGRNIITLAHAPTRHSLIVAIIKLAMASLPLMAAIAMLDFQMQRLTGRSLESAEVFQLYTMGETPVRWQETFGILLYSTLKVTWMLAGFSYFAQKAERAGYDRGWVLLPCIIIWAFPDWASQYFLSLDPYDNSWVLPAILMLGTLITFGIVLENRIAQTENRLLLPWLSGRIRRAAQAIMVMGILALLSGWMLAFYRYQGTGKEPGLGKLTDFCRHDKLTSNGIGNALLTEERKRFAAYFQRNPVFTRQEWSLVTSMHQPFWKRKNDGKDAPGEKRLLQAHDDSNGGKIYLWTVACSTGTEIPDEPDKPQAVWQLSLLVDSNERVTDFGLLARLKEGYIGYSVFGFSLYDPLDRHVTAQRLLGQGNTLEATLIKEGAVPMPDNNRKTFYHQRYFRYAPTPAVTSPMSGLWVPAQHEPVLCPALPPHRVCNTGTINRWEEKPHVIIVDIAGDTPMNISIQPECNVFPDAEGCTTAEEPAAPSVTQQESAAASGLPPSGEIVASPEPVRPAPLRLHAGWIFLLASIIWGIRIIFCAGYRRASPTSAPASTPRKQS